MRLPTEPSLLVCLQFVKKLSTLGEGIAEKVRGDGGSTHSAICEEVRMSIYPPWALAPRDSATARANVIVIAPACNSGV